MSCRALFAAVALFAGTVAGAESLDYGRLGTVSVSRPAGEPVAVALLASDAGGPGVLDAELTRTLTARGVLVFGLDGGRLWRQAQAEMLAEAATDPNACVFIGWDFEAFSQYAQKTLGLKDYRQPVLAGIGLGAQLVWLAEAQSTVNTFRGALTLGFDPDWTSARPLCDGDQGAVSQAMPDGRGERLAAGTDLRIRWTALQGANDARIAADAVRAFVARVPQARMVTVPDAALAAADPAPWLAPFATAWDAIAAPPPAAALAGLPLIELPVNTPPAAAGADWLAVILTGDGGWADIDRELGERFQAEGIAVVGFNILKYLWRARTPEETAHDVERVLNHYREAWSRRRVLLVGYSFGADVLPFVVNRLSAEARAPVALAALLAPSRHVEFEFHPWNWISEPDDANNPRARPIAPELARLPVRALCIYGTADKDDTVCADTGAGNSRLTVLELPGGHHFDEDYRKLAERVFAAARGGAGGAP